ncbi:MAG: 3-isopropylmalate dehydratase [Betaproteobacteria bacterium]|nr:3-isopropylmalate dehydratase [Betaproteobacteria bacterium]
MALENITGRIAWIFPEEDFDVDQIVGVKNIKITDIEELAAQAMKDYDPGFAQQVRPGDVLVGGVNFGYGHPHYPPLRAMRHLGIRALIAESFSPGFWRGEISMGFPMVACPGILTVAKRWESLTIDWARQQVVFGSGTTLPFLPLASADLSMLEHGGLTGYLKHRAAASATP